MNLSVDNTGKVEEKEKVEGDKKGAGIVVIMIVSRRGEGGGKATSGR